MGSKPRASTTSVSATAATLYLVPTPIGHPDDVTLRALRVLAEVDIVAAEDTRTTLRFLRQHDVTAKSLISYHDHNEQRRAEWLVEQLEGGKSVALVSDAGTPLIGDPGYRLLQAVVERSIPVVGLPGPCAAITALAASGLPATRFIFVGFLSRKDGQRRSAIGKLRSVQETLILYEAPHRALKTLECLMDELGDRRAVLAWNLTKPQERLIHGTLSSIVAELRSWEFVHGEMTLVVAGAEDSLDPALKARAEQAAVMLVERGIETRVVRDLVVDLTGVDRKALYQFLNRRRTAAEEDD